MATDILNHSVGIKFDLGYNMDILNDSCSLSPPPPPPPVDWSTHPGLPQPDHLMAECSQSDHSDDTPPSSADELIPNGLDTSPSVHWTTHPGVLHPTTNLKQYTHFSKTKKSKSKEKEKAAPVTEQVIKTKTVTINIEENQVIEDSAPGPGVDNNERRDNSTDTDDKDKRKAPSISTALELLTNELKLLQEQDIALLKQLMQIHFTMRMLKRNTICRRTNSVCTFQTQPAVNPINPDWTPPTYVKRHPVLSRVQSEPSRYGFLVTQGSLGSMEEEDETEEDFLASSINSVDLEPELNRYNGMLQLSLDLNDGTSELLEDMPISLRRKYLTALTSHPPLNTNTSTPIRDTTSPSPPTANMLRRRFSRQDAMRISRSSSIESDGGIEITASV